MPALVQEYPKEKSQMEPAFSSQVRPSHIPDSSFSVTKKIMEKLGVPLVSSCTQCLGMGFYYRKGGYSQGEKWEKGEKWQQRAAGFSLCSCISAACGEEHCYLPYERYNAKKQALVPCECRSARLTVDRISHLEKRASIPYKYAGCFLDNISLTGLPKTNDLKYAQGCVEECIYNFHKKEETFPKRRGIYLQGGTGCGKTLLSCALLNEMLRFHKIPVKYAKINRDILAKIRSSYNPNSNIYGEGVKIGENLGKVPVLVIDDFEIFRETDWVQSILYDVIDARYENDLLTIINSNHYMSFWKDTASGRIYSRLREMCEEINIEGVPDYRMKLSGEEA